jgi:hypothetical protein
MGRRVYKKGRTFSAPALFIGNKKEEIYALAQEAVPGRLFENWIKPPMGSPKQQIQGPF